jgi:ABC-2 type transport system permease protein
MRKIIAIALTDLRSEFQSPAAWFVIFIMPLILTFILSNVGGGGGGPVESRTALLVVNEDGGEGASQIMTEINNSDIVMMQAADEGESLPTTREAALAGIGDYGRVLLLPAGLSDALTSGTPIEVELYVDPTTTAERTQTVQQELNTIFYRVAGNRAITALAVDYAGQLRPFENADAQADFADATGAALATRSATSGVAIAAEPATALEVIPMTGAVQASPGQLVVFALITLLGASEVFMAERQLGTLRRLLTCAVPKWQIITGKAAGRLAVGLLQMTVLIGVGQFVFGVSWGQNPVALVLLVLVFSLAALGLGILIATIVRSYEQANQLTIALSLLFGALGGAWWPLDIVEGPMRTVAMLIPTGWAMSGFQSIILRGADTMDILPNLVVLAGFAVLFFGVGVSRLKFE